MNEFFSKLFKSKSEDKEKEDNIEKLANNPEVKNVTLKHLKELSIPEANSSPKPLTEEEIETHVDEEGVEGTENKEKSSPKPLTDEEVEMNVDLGDEEVIGNESSGGLKLAPFKEEGDSGKETGSEAPEEKKDGGTEKGTGEVNVPQPVKELAKKLTAKKDENGKTMEDAPDLDKTELPGEPTDGGEHWTGLRASKYKKDGKQRDFFSSTVLDKVQTGVDVVSGVSGIVGPGIGLFDKSGLGGKMGMSDTVSDSVDITSQGVNMASDGLSFLSYGMSMGKDIMDKQKNDKFTTDSTKQMQNLKLASNILGMGKSSFSMLGTSSDMIGSIGNIAGHGELKPVSEQVGGGLRSVKHTLGATKDTLDLVRGATTGLGNITSYSKISEAMKEGGTSEEFKRMANVALEAKKLNATSAGFDIFKSGTSLVGNITGLTKSMSKMLGVAPGSTMGDFAKWTGVVGNIVTGVGAVTGLFNTILLKPIMKSKRKKNNIDQFIKTGELKDKTNDVLVKKVKKGRKGKDVKKVVDDETVRGLAKTALGYSSLDEMFSAILMKYAATIRHNAENGEEKDKYRLLIEQLGFKVQINNELPSEEAIAGKLAGIDG